jgi:hypothetical protein
MQAMKSFIALAEKATTEKQSYTEKLETATGDDIFKYLLLINVSALEGYVAQTRMQAQQSFNLSGVIAIVGFLIVAAGILSNVLGYAEFKAAYLASIAGILTEFISGIFFYLYSRTLQQLNIFSDKLATTQQISMSFLANSLMDDKTKKDESRSELAKLLMSNSLD